MRPGPEPSRAARSASSSGPLRLQSDASSVSLLVTPVMWQAGDGSLSSTTVTPIATSIIFLLAGHRLSGVAVSPVMAGDVTAGRFGQGDGPGPKYVTHQFLSNVLRAPLAAASSLMSNPIGP